jgi:hypothetical protein
MRDFGRWFAEVTLPRDNRLSNPFSLLPSVLSKDKGETTPRTIDNLATARRKRKEAAARRKALARVSEDTDETVTAHNTATTTPRATDINTPRTNTATSWITIEPTNDNNTTEDAPRTPNVNAFNEITQDELYQVVFLENAPCVSPPPPYNITATGADENGSEITIVGREVEDEDVAPTPARTPARTQAQTQSDRLEMIRQRLRDFRDGVTASAPGMTRRTWRRRRGA